MNMHTRDHGKRIVKKMTQIHNFSEKPKPSISSLKEKKFYDRSLLSKKTEKKRAVRPLVIF